ncbi:toxin-antitoxin system, antitoxin component, Xre domain protein [Burkholderia multivorans ATCC BAA-247]|nr:toxin-antitoxin system, antitoxin component, Xre domain protein [Burkholderia multivorans ATCC BAA-247]
MEDVMPIRSDAEYQQVLEAIRAASDAATSDERLLALRQRAEAYERRLRVDPKRLRALEELAAQAQDLKMGYD